MHKIFNLYKCDCKIVVAEGKKSYSNTYFIIASREEIAVRKAFNFMTKEYEEEFLGKTITFQPSISCFVYNVII